MKKNLLAATLFGIITLTIGATPGADARSLREDAAGGYDFVIMKPIKVPTEDFPGVLRIVTNEYAGLIQEIPELKTFEDVRFDGKRKHISHQGDDRTMVVVIGGFIPDYMRKDLTELFPDIEATDFDRYNQGFSFTGVQRERDNGEITTVSFALLGNPDADAPVEAASADRQRVYIREGLEVALPPNVEFVTSLGMDRQDAGVTTFSGMVEISKDDAVKMIVDSFREGGVEPQVNEQGDSTTVSDIGNGHSANFMIRHIETEEGEPSRALVQALISSQN